MKGERTIRGLRCSEVIARLDAYAAGELSADERRAVVLHVSECPLCEEFGGRYAKTILSIRRAREEEAPSADAKERLLGKLRGLR